MEKLKSISRKSEFAQISNSNIVVTTCLSAIQWPDKVKGILISIFRFHWFFFQVKKNFDLIVIDEAAFAPDWLTMPLALSGIKQLILAGDHCQLPPVVVSDTDCQTNKYFFSWSFLQYYFDFAIEYFHRKIFLRCIFSFRFHEFSRQFWEQRWAIFHTLISRFF